MRKFLDYARSFAETLDARKAYKWASGVCAAAALVLALDASSVEDKYTPPKDTRTDLEVVMGVVEKNTGNYTFHLPTGKEIIINRKRVSEGLDKLSIKGVSTIMEGVYDGELDPKTKCYVESEEFAFYPESNKFEPMEPRTNGPGGYRSLTEEEIEEVKTKYREAFSDITKRLRRNIEIERRFREDVLTTGKYVYAKVPIFNYSWMPSWLDNLFSRRVVSGVEKEYDTPNGKIKIEVGSPTDKNNRFFSLYCIDDVDGCFRSQSYDHDGDGYFGAYGNRTGLTVPDHLAPLVSMEDEK